MVYHHFGHDTPESTSVTPELFEEHLQFLKENDFSVIFMSEAAERLKSGEPFPERCVVLTADDAYTTVLSGAMPLLEKYGFPMSIFVTTEGVKRGYDAYLSWEQMRRMKKSGLVEFGNHSHTHEHFILGGADFEADLLKAAALLKRELGGDNGLYAYPYGEFDFTMMAVLADHGYAGIAQHSGAVGHSTHEQVIVRYPMAVQFAQMGEFRTKARSRAFDVMHAEPSDPILHELDKPYRLELQIAKGDYRVGELACYMSFQGRQEVEWIAEDETSRTLAVTTDRAPGLGRTRINCTAPSPKGFYWYSHPIFNLSDPRALD
jgi:peptidoglycan/xylan/chitin deacetylase (PgdA/CDA1 family)